MHLKFFIAWLLTALCIVVHAIGVMALLRWGSNAVTRMGSRFWFFDLDARSHCGVYHSPVVMMLIATLTASLVTNSGRSTWCVGVLVLMMYVIFAMTLYLLPPRSQ